MNFLFPDHRALCMAENATHNLHNILTLRGAQVRDARVWSRYLTRRSPVRRRHRRRLRLPPLAHLGHRAHRHLPRRSSATSTPTCTTRPCACSTRASPAPRSPRRSSCRPRWTAPGTPAATTARSATTSRPSTSATWAGSTATRPTCGSTRRWRRPRRYVECMGGADAVRGQGAQSTLDAGDLRFAATCSTTPSSPTRTTPRPGSCWPQVYERLGLRRRERHLAQLLPRGRQELRGGDRRRRRPTLASPEMIGRPDRRAALRLPRHPHQRAQALGRDAGHRLVLHRPGRTYRTDPLQRRPHPRRRRPRRRRRRAHPHAHQAAAARLLGGRQLDGVDARGGPEGGRRPWSAW